MTGNWVYIVLMVVILAALVFLMVRVRGIERNSRISPLIGLAMACFMGGLILADQRWLSYGLLGAGLVLAVIDILKRQK